MRVSDFDYTLPDDSIAINPPEVRGTSRLLVLDKQSGGVQHRRYADLPDDLETGDVLVMNDTKVIKARLLATNRDGKPRELLLLEDHHNTDFTTRKVLYRGKIHQNLQ